MDPMVGAGSMQGKDGPRSTVTVGRFNQATPLHLSIHPYICSYEAPFGLPLCGICHSIYAYSIHAYIGSIHARNRLPPLFTTISKGRSSLVVMVMAKHNGKGSPRQDLKEPVSHDAGAADRPWQPPLRFEPCSHCDEHRQADGSGGAGPLVLTLGSATGADHRPCQCSCGVAPAPAPETMSVLRGSRYLRPAQELLSEVVHMADLVAGSTDDEGERQEQLEAAGAHRAMMHRAAKNDADGVQAKLLGLLSELESRQERYFGELGRVASSFEPALGPGAAASYTSLMAQAMARHFGNLRRAILRRLKLHAAAAAARRRPAALREADDGADDEEDEDDEVTEERVDRVARRTKLAAAARAEQAWRPLRGLPERSVAVLRAWLFDHFLHPYPDDSEKLRLAVATGLSRSQISNWFINARVRLWKPMIEEMYNDEFSEDSVSTSGASSS